MAAMPEPDEVRPGAGKRRAKAAAKARGLQPAATRERVKALLRKYQDAKTRWNEVAKIVDECYEFCVPLRERPFGAKTPSARRTDRLYDTTAVHALADFASQRVEDVWPTDQKPIDLLPGHDIPAEQQGDLRVKLADIANEAIVTINNSNFREQANEACLDYGIVQGVLLVDEGDALEPLRHRALPFTEAVLSAGPYGEHDGLFRPRKVKAHLLPVLWPGGDFSADMKRAMTEQPEREFEIIEGYWRDWSRPKEEIWCYSCVEGSGLDGVGGHEIATSEAKGIGSKPFVSFAFMRVPGEVNGRGPAQLSLPDIRSINVVQQLLLEHLDVSIGGVYQMEDNGVLNTDTIMIQAGTVYPKMAGTKGLEPIEIGGNPQFGMAGRDQLKQAIERAFFKLDLGPTDKTPKSATEILQRVADRAGRLSGPNARLTSEFLLPYIRRVLWLLREMGRIKIPRLDHGFLSIRPLAPITRAQAQDDILRHKTFVEILVQTVGPQVANLVVDGTAYADFIAHKMGIEPSVIRSEPARKELGQTIANLAATAAAPGAPANPEAQAPTQ